MLKKSLSNKKNAGHSGHIYTLSLLNDEQIKVTTNLNSLPQNMQHFLGVLSSCNNLILLLQQFFKKVLSAYFKSTDMLHFQTIFAMTWMGHIETFPPQEQ